MANKNHFDFDKIDPIYIDSQKEGLKNARFYKNNFIEYKFN